MWPFDGKLNKISTYNICYTARYHVEMEEIPDWKQQQFGFYRLLNRASAPASLDSKLRELGGISTMWLRRKVAGTDVDCARQAAFAFNIHYRFLTTFAFSRHSHGWGGRRACRWSRDGSAGEQQKAIETRPRASAVRNNEQHQRAGRWKVRAGKYPAGTASFYWALQGVFMAS